jgi:hypothetical protein
MSWAEFQAKLDARAARRAARPWPVRALDAAWTALRRGVRWLTVPRPWHRLRWRWQRSQRGWADRDVWSLDDYLAGLIGEAVEQLRRYGHGFPNGMTSEEWDATLGRISRPLLAYRQHWNWREGDPPGEWLRRQEVFMASAESALHQLADVLPCLYCRDAQSSVHELARYFSDLWD